MSGLELTFALIGVVGFVFLLGSLMFGELGELASGDLGATGDFDGFGPSLTDLSVVATGLVGAGAFGFISLQLGAITAAAVVTALVGYVAISAAAFYGILKPLSRQQSNSQLSRESYVDKEATVVLDIPADGTGLIEFTDMNGARVRQRAIADEPIGHGRPVLIYSIDTDYVRVIPNPTELS